MGGFRLSRTVELLCAKFGTCHCAVLVKGYRRIFAVDDFALHNFLNCIAANCSLAFAWRMI